MDINKSKIIKVPSLGNGLVASEDLKAGEAIIRISSPYVVVIEKAALTTACSYCLYESHSLKRCSKCKVVQYCSPVCQVLAWKSEHKKECAVLKSLPDVPPTAVRALIQVLQRHSFGAAPDPRWEGLETNLGPLKRSRRWEEIVLQAKAGIAFSKSPASWSDAAIGVLCRMTNNAFRIVLADNTVVGLCFEPILALANHSCTPNASVMFDGRTVTLRTLDPIKKDEQIFISYIDSTARRGARQAELNDHYFFTCHCEKCENNDSSYSSWQKHHRGPPNSRFDLLIPPSSFTSLTQSPPKTQPSSTALVSTSSTSSAAREDFYTALANPTQPPHPTLLHTIYLQHLNNASYEPALTLLLFIHLHSDPILYPQPHHPIRTIRLFTLARLCLQLMAPGNPALASSLDLEYREVMESVDWVSTAQVLLILAKEATMLIHGVESKFYREVEGELRDVESVQKGRGVVGEALRAWGEGGTEEEGRRYAEKVCEGLRIVGGRGCAEAVVRA